MATLVSVIIPAYNASLFLEETIRSVINQTYTNFEIIVVDDGSTDSTEKVVQNLVNEGLPIKLIYQSNKGVSAARNLGFKNSKGFYILFLDADDVLLPNNIEAKIRKIEENESFGLVHTDMAFINAHSVKTGDINKGLEGNILDDLLLWDRCVIPAPSSIMVKKSVCEDVGLFCEELSTAADQEFFFRVAAKYKIGRIAECLGLYRVHTNNMSKRIALLERDHILAYRIAEKNNLFKSFWFKQRCFSNMYLILAACWWGDGKNKMKGVKLLLISMLTYPMNFKKVFAKFING